MDMNQQWAVELVEIVEDIMLSKNGFIHLTSSCGEQELSLRLKEDLLERIVELLETYDDSHRISILDSSFNQITCTPSLLVDAIRIGRSNINTRIT